MGILEHTSNFQNCIKKTNKIPEYAREFKNEYLFIRGINKTCERFLKILDLDAKIFNSPQAYQLKLYIKRFVKAKELGYLEDNSNFKFKESDVNFINSLDTQIDDYMDLFYDPDSYEFDEEKYENDYPGLKEFSECFSKFKDKIKIEELSFSDFKRDLSYLDSDSEDSMLDSDSDSD